MHANNYTHRHQKSTFCSQYFLQIQIMVTNVIYGTVNKQVKKELNLVDEL